MANSLHDAAFGQSPLPHGWSWRWLDEVMEIRGGAQPEASTFIGEPRPGYIRFVQIRDFDTDGHVTYIKDSNKWRKCQKSDVLIARYGASLGRILRGIEGAYNVALVKAEPTNIDQSFLYYLLRSKFFQGPIIQSGARSAQAGFNKRDLSVVPIPVPPTVEQRAIAAILRALDDKIELNSEMSETLEAMARALFKSWFIDFDPVRAKAKGRDTGLPPEIAALFPDACENSELGEIPKGWHVRTLGHVLDTIECGSRPRGGVSTYRSGVPSVGAESIIGVGIFDYGKTKFVPRAFYESMRRGICNQWDVLLYKDGGKPGKYEPHATLIGEGFPFEEFCINEHVYRLRADATIGQTYLYLCLTSNATMEDLRQKGTGVAVPGLNSTALSSVEILVPNDAVIARFERIAKPIIRSILIHASQSRTLAALRDALLPKLISGEIRVADAERVVEKSA